MSETLSTDPTVAETAPKARSFVQAKDSVSLPSPMVSILALATGNLTATLLRILAGLLTARLVAPATLGLFNAMGLVIGYAPFFHAGVFNGLSRELPYYLGRGETGLVHELTASAQAWALVLGGVAFLALGGLAGWYWLQGQPKEAQGWFSYAIAIFVFFYAQIYLQTTYRTGNDFARLGMVNAVQAGVAVLLVVLVWKWQFSGLCLRNAIVALISLGLLWYWRPMHIKPRWHLASLKHLLKIGAPIFVVGQLYAWWSVLDSTLVLRCLGHQGMGLYSLVIMGYTGLSAIPIAVSQVVYPRMAEQYGRTSNVRDAIRQSLRPTLLGALGMVPIVSFCWMIAPPVVRVLLPRYLEAVPALQWEMVAIAMMSFLPLFNIFNVVKHQVYYGIAIACGMLTYLGVLFGVLRGNTLAHFPLAMFVGHIVFVLIGCAFVWHLWRTHDPAPASIDICVSSSQTDL